MQSRTLVLKLFFLSIASTVAFSQEKGAPTYDVGGTGFFQSQEEYHQFFGGLKSLNDPEISAILPLIHDITTGRPIGSTPGYVGQSPLLEILSDPKVRENIDMVDFQYEELTKLNQTVQQRMSKQLKEIDLSDSASLAQRVKEIRDASRRELENVLLPHQVSRLRQLSAQTQLRRRSMTDLLTTNPLRDELEIDDEQVEELREAEASIERELAEQIEVLRSEARQKLLANLRREQRDKFEEIFGELFEFTPQEKIATKKATTKSDVRKREK